MEEPTVARTQTSKRAASRVRKKATIVNEGDSSESLQNAATTEEDGTQLAEATADSQKPKRRTRRKATSASTTTGEESTEKKSRRGRKSKKKVDDADIPGTKTETIDTKKDTHTAIEDNEDDIDLVLAKHGDDDDDVSSTYSWPPLVCCFGSAQHAFVPSGRPANRLIDHEIHERLKDALWAPERFVRAPGGSAGGVAIALARLGGRVAFMGKLGDDDFGKAMLYYLNVSGVQTRSVRIDGKRMTAVTEMKVSKRGGFRMSTVKACAEDSLSKSEINIDVLKEAKMFYFNTSSLLDENMRKTTLRAINISKKLGAVVFYDVNLPLPLWQSDEQTKSFIQQVWNLADVVEVTKQELEFLCGIKPSEEFDTKDNKRSKFIHYESDVIEPLWHDTLKVMFVTNGTSKIHYYTKEHDGAVHGMEDPPLTPFTQDMSASGDGIVAALMRMLTVQPHLITDKDYLEHSIKYAIDCGVIDQWIVGRQQGFPPKEGMEDEELVPDPNGIVSITEREFRTLVPVSEG